MQEREQLEREQLEREQLERELEQLYTELMPMIDNMYPEIIKLKHSDELKRAIQDIRRLSIKDIIEEIKQMKSIINILSKVTITTESNLGYRFFIMKPCSGVRTLFIVEGLTNDAKEIICKIPNNINRVQLSSKYIIDRVYFDSLIADSVTDGWVERLTSYIEIYIKELEQLHMDKYLIELNMDKNKLKIFIDNKKIEWNELK